MLTLALEIHFPAALSSNLDSNSPSCNFLLILKTLNSLFRCVCVCVCVIRVKAELCMKVDLKGKS